MKAMLVILLFALPLSSAAAQETSSASEPELARAIVRRMQSDLRNLLSVQEVHYSRAYTYAGPAEDVDSLTALAYVASRGVDIRVLQADERGWSGVATSPDLPGRGCGVFVGSATPPMTAGGKRVETPGVVTCD